MDIKNKTITITSVSSKDGRYVIKDHEGNIFSFFQALKVSERNPQGGNTKAYCDFVNFKIKNGDTYTVGYTTKEVEGKVYMNIINFKEPDSLDKAEVPPFVTPTETKAIEKKEEDKWAEIGRGKVRHGFAIEAYKMKRELNSDLVAEINAWTEFVMTSQLPK